MIIHLTSSRTNVTEDVETLRQIMRLIHKSGHVLARDWIEPYYHISVSKTAKEMDPEQVYRSNMDAIERADLVIVEASFKSFGAGFHVSAALSKRKPTLLLVRKDVENESTFSRGVRDELLRRREYAGSDELESIVSQFIDDYTFKTKDLRFNFVLDPQLYNHIRWKSFKTKKTKAEIVRELLIQDMEGGD